MILHFHIHTLLLTLRMEYFIELNTAIENN